MDPVTWAIIGTSLAVAGTAGSTYSQVKAAESQAEGYKSESKAREVEAQSVREAAAFEETQFRRKAAISLSKGQVVGAASGLDTTSGSLLFTDIDNARQAELEALNIRRTGAVGSESKLYESRVAKYGAKLSRAKIPGIIMGGVGQVGSSILAGWGAAKGYGGGGGMN